MIVVSDTTPLITLMKVDGLHLLNNLFGKVLIPQAVFTELTSNQEFVGEAALIRESDFIEVLDAIDANKVYLLRRATGLDLGESEAIVYADEAGADLLLIDESAGRKVAQRMGLRITGSIGILIQAVRLGYASPGEAEAMLDGIRKSNRRVSGTLLQEARETIRGIS